MQLTKGKISVRQSFIILLLAIASPSLRILPIFASEEGKQASWVAVILVILPLLLLIYMYNSFFKKYEDKSLDEIFTIVAGKFIGKIFAFIYIVWALFLFSLYLRYFCERFLSTILVDTPIEFMILVMLGFIYYIISNNIEAFARMAELFLYVFFAIFIGVFLIVLPDIKLTNLYPVTFYDVPGIMKATLPLFSLAGFVTYIFFIGDQMSYKETIKKYGTRFALINMFMGVVLVVTVVGVIGAEVAPKFPIPYFTVIKSIEILNTIERIESIFIAIWVVNDCIILGMFGYILLGLLKRFCNTTNSNIFVVPVIFFGYVGSLYIASSSLELHEFSREIGALINMVTAIIIPVTVFIIGKIRKKI